MTITVPVSDLKQRTGKVLSQAVVERQDVIIERYGEEYAVVLSRERYQELVDAARARVRERFLEAEREIREATSGMSSAEIKGIVAEAVRTSRMERVASAGGS